MRLFIIALLFAISYAQTDRRLLNRGRSCGGVDCNANGDENAFCIYSDHCSCSYNAGFMCEEGGLDSDSECHSRFSCVPSEPICCRAMTAQCLACVSGQSVEEYCAGAEENIPGCPREEEPSICCKALTTQCLACTVGQSVEEYCAEAEEDIAGCPREEEPYDELGQGMLKQLQKAFTHPNDNQRKLKKSWSKIKKQVKKFVLSSERGRKRYDPTQMNIVNKMHQLVLQEPTPMSTNDAQWVSMTELWENLMDLVNSEDP